MSTRTAMQNALSVYRNRATMSRPALEKAVVELSQWRLWSNRHIETFTGLSRPAVAALARKPERTGGRFVPEALEACITLQDQRFRGKVDADLVAQVLEMGVSTSFLSKLTGIPQRTIARMAGMK